VVFEPPLPEPLLPLAAPLEPRFVPPIAVPPVVAPAIDEAAPAAELPVPPAGLAAPPAELPALMLFESEFSVLEQPTKAQAPERQPMESRAISKPVRELRRLRMDSKVSLGTNDGSPGCRTLHRAHDPLAVSGMRDGLGFRAHRSLFLG
jgi:hypothetical protein